MRHYSGSSGIQVYVVVYAIPNIQMLVPRDRTVAMIRLSIVTTTRGDLMLREMILISLVFFLVTLPTASLWTYSGTLISNYLRTPKHLKTFNWVMAGLLVDSLVPILI
jgi:threonine/homoserine/homoserine lactone efflux protein